MNNINYPTTSEIENLATPYCLGPDIDPRHYLAGLGQWPSLPTQGLKSAVPAATKKLIGKLLADRGEQTVIRQKNDVAEARRQMLVAARDGSDHGAFEAERISREIAKMDLDAYGSALTRLREVEQEAQAAAAALIPLAADAKLEAFIAEAKEVEARLIRHNRPLSSTANEEGYTITRWQLWKDEILSGIFGEYWFLTHYWMNEFQTPRYENRDCLGWLAEVISTED
jgi:hypothetical protein